jgi:lipoyl(octanoyl) transferase
MEKLLRVCRMGTVKYSDALTLQESLHKARVEGRIPDTLLILEHSDVFTLGRNADEDNLLEPEASLKSQGFEVARTGRGGDVTYHGPGQLVGYPIISLKEGGYGVNDYVSVLEEVIIGVLRVHGIESGRDDRNRGVWVGDSKIAAIGLRISRGVAMHGFALNVSTDLTKYKKIVPCGISDGGVTSMKKNGYLGGVEAVADELVKSFALQLEYQEIKNVERNDIEKA